MEMMQKMGIKTKLKMQLGIFLTGLLVVGLITGLNFNKVKVTGPLYTEIILGKDLLADILPPPEYIIESMTQQKFARYIVQIFTLGDIAVIQESNYGKEGCQFIAEALAHFGGYSSVAEIY